LRCRQARLAGDHLAHAAAFAVVGDPLSVSAQVAVELAHRREQLARFIAGVERFQVNGDVADCLESAENVAVPEVSTATET
jgi:hypothetical protein